ncbi:MAG: serine/threonine protein kinase [Bradymonadales bacterium]|nr:serine/threonine protein kinase [Bradymonadales bacterium]
MQQVTTTRPFGRYQLERLIGRGGMGEIYLARMEGAAGFRKPVVIKKILPHLAQQPEFLTRFIDEARIVVTLTHGNIVPVLDMGEVEGEYFIAMEYIPGRDLGEVLRRYRELGELMPVRLGAFVISETCRALDYAHQKTDDQGQELRIVHRDVSPSNILLSHEGVVKLTDFGIAKAVSKLGRSITGQLQGKFCYMSPEQASGEMLDHRGDIFSLGTVAYEVFTGVRLFEGENDLDTLKRVRQARVMRPSARREGLSARLDAVVSRALAQAPRDRYQTAREFGTELLQAGDPEGKTGAADLAEELRRLFPGGVSALGTPPSGMGLDAIMGMEAERLLLASPSGRSPTLTAPVRVRQEEREVAVRPTPPSLQPPLFTPQELAAITGMTQIRPRYGWVLLALLVLAAVALVLLYLWPGYLLPSYLEVSCNEAGAEIRVDNQNRGICPVRLEVGPGTHTVFAWKGELEAEQRVRVERGAVQTVDLLLQRVRPEPIEVTVRTEPVGEFSLDHGSTWHASGTQLELSPGAVDIWARLDGSSQPQVIPQYAFTPQRTELLIPLSPPRQPEPRVDAPDAGEPDLSAEELEEPAVEVGIAPSPSRVRLRVSVNPPDAWIYDGTRPVSQGSANLSFGPDDPPHTIRAVAEGYEPEEWVFDPRNGSDRKDFTLHRRSQQRYPIRIVPYNYTGCRATIDGQLQPEVLPNNFELVTGEHTVLVECEERGLTEEQVIEVVESDQVTVHRFLTPPR